MQERDETPNHPSRQRSCRDIAVEVSSSTDASHGDGCRSNYRERPRPDPFLTAKMGHNSARNERPRYLGRMARIERAVARGLLLKFGIEPRIESWNGSLDERLCHDIESGANGERLGVDPQILSQLPAKAAVADTDDHRSDKSRGPCLLYTSDAADE